MTRATNYLRNRVPAEIVGRRAGAMVALAVAIALAAGPEVVTVSRAVVNLPVTAVSVAWGRAHGGTCDMHGDLTVTCSEMHGGYANAGTTVGNAWLYDDLGGAVRQRHETRHSDQWAMLGIAFPALYGAECARTRNDYQHNVFERWAGLHDGGYLP
jgi:hypothetical protein